MNNNLFSSKTLKLSQIAFDAEHTHLQLNWRKNRIENGKSRGKCLPNSRMNFGGFQLLPMCYRMYASYAHTRNYKKQSSSVFLFAFISHQHVSRVDVDADDINANNMAAFK